MADCFTGLPMGYSRARAPPANIVVTRTAANRRGRRINISWRAVIEVFDPGPSPFASQLQSHLGRGKALASGPGAHCVRHAVLWRKTLACSPALLSFSVKSWRPD